MKITIKLFANFRLGRFKVKEAELSAGTTCADVVASLGLTEEELGIVLVNGRHASVGHLLADGETLSLFPLVGGG